MSGPPPVHAYDALSRQSEQISINLAQESEIQKMSCSEILRAYEADETLKKLKTLVEIGFPESKKCLQSDLKPFWNFCNNLIAKDSMFYCGDRIIAPKLLRSKILKMLHGAHQGSRSMELRAGKLWFWPGMASDIQGFKNNC